MLQGGLNDPHPAAPGAAGLLQAARSGDELAYQRLVEPHSRELQAHAYRMLGSVHDAEDAVQDALLRAWRGLPRFDGRSSLRAWLYKIATNTCLDTIARRGKRALPIDHVAAAELGEAPGRPLVESVWVQPCSDVALGLDDGRATPEARYEQRESVELAFIAALQHLPATQRAVLILREVLGFSAQETAELLETTVASVNSALQRARRTIDERLPDQSQQETLRALGDEGLREVVENYMDAMGRGDVEAVVAMLAEDAAWSMPPMATWYRGRDALRRFLEMGPLSGAWRWRHVPGRANGQPAIGAYTWRDDEGCYRPFALDVLTLGADGSKIAQVTSFIARSGDELSPGELLRFPDEDVDAAKVGSIFTLCGLPERLD
ncbi:MAG: sigma-70 family RNA polymerase sigma factor [Solirubrobacteraceae bacterium]|nr:sigma-70 family RNA polymerase sigma factor [Solirubrobacteraceae bacterium]